jgi:type IV secretion system protein VirD4
LQQLAAQREIANITQQLMQGANPFELGPSYAHQARIAVDRKKMSRRLMTSDEILRLPHNRQILYVRDFNCPPVYARRKRYYEFPALSGWFLPNPFHPPTDRVLIATRGGMRWARVVTERVPKCFANFPQYQQSGMWSYVDGFHPLSLNLGGLL